MVHEVKLLKEQYLTRANLHFLFLTLISSAIKLKVKINNARQGQITFMTWIFYMVLDIGIAVTGQNCATEASESSKYPAKIYSRMKQGKYLPKPQFGKKDSTYCI